MGRLHGSGNVYEVNTSHGLVLFCRRGQSTFGGESPDGDFLVKFLCKETWMKREKCEAFRPLREGGCTMEWVVGITCSGNRLRRENTVLPYGSENNVKLALFETGGAVCYANSPAPTEFSGGLR